MVRPPRQRTHSSERTRAEQAASDPAAPLEARLAGLEAQLVLLKAQVRQAQQLSSLGTTAAIFAHEVNNLLTPILSYAIAAQDSGDVEFQKKALGVTIKNVQMLVGMSDRALEITAAKPAERESVSLRTVVENAAASLCRDLSKDGIRFVVDVDDSMTVRADPLQLQQVFFNLFVNAREAMVPTHSGRLSVCATRQDGQVIIEVHNTGESIPTDLLPHIFEPFQTSKPAARAGRPRCGGLGLALCRDLIEENGGTIGVTSAPPEGTTFAIALPAPGPTP